MGIAFIAVAVVVGMAVHSKVAKKYPTLLT
jgi:hypothetical protein